MGGGGGNHRALDVGCPAHATMLGQAQVRRSNLMKGRPARSGSTVTSCSTMETGTRRVTTDTNVLILGGTGMLGSMLVDVLSRAEGIAVRATCRRAGRPRQEDIRG